MIRVAITLLAAAGFAAGQAATNHQAQQYRDVGEQSIPANNLDEAVKNYERLAQLNPKAPEVQAKLGLAYYMQGRFADAVTAFRTAQQINPALPNVGVLLAICYAELGRYREALPGLERGFRHAPDQKIRRLLGLELLRSYIGLDRQEPSLQTALELRRLYADDPEILYNTGHLFGDLALDSMKRLAAVAPDSIWVRQAIAETYEAQGQNNLAVAAYREVLAIDPKRPEIHFRIGHIMLSRVDSTSAPEEALKEFEQEYALDRSSGAAYEIAEIHRKNGQLDKAGEFFELAIKTQPDFEEAQIGLGRVLLQLEKPREALPYLKRAVELNPANEVSHYQLALVYHALGDAASQARELAEFSRLHRDAAERHNSILQGRPEKGDVTRQTIDRDPSR